MSLLVHVDLLEVHVGPLGVLLLQVFVQGVHVAEDEVQLVVLATLVWPEHDGVGCAVVELLLWCEHREEESLHLYVIHYSLD